MDDWPLDEKERLTLESILIKSESFTDPFTKQSPVMPIKMFEKKILAMKRLPEIAKENDNLARKICEVFTCNSTSNVIN